MHQSMSIFELLFCSALFLLTQAAQSVKHKKDVNNHEAQDVDPWELWRISRNLSPRECLELLEALRAEPTGPRMNKELATQQSCLQQLHRWYNGLSGKELVLARGKLAGALVLIGKPELIQHELEGSSGSPRNYIERSKLGRSYPKYYENLGLFRNSKLIEQRNMLQIQRDTGLRIGDKSAIRKRSNGETKFEGVQNNTTSRPQTHSSQKAFEKNAEIYQILLVFSLLLIIAICILAFLHLRTKRRNNAANQFRRCNTDEDSDSDVCTCGKSDNNNETDTPRKEGEFYMIGKREWKNNCAKPVPQAEERKIPEQIQFHPPPFTCEEKPRRCGPSPRVITSDRDEKSAAPPAKKAKKKKKQSCRSAGSSRASLTRDVVNPEGRKRLEKKIERLMRCSGNCSQCKCCKCQDKAEAELCKRKKLRFFGRGKRDCNVLCDDPKCKENRVQSLVKLCEEGHKTKKTCSKNKLRESAKPKRRSFLFSMSKK